MAGNTGIDLCIGALVLDIFGFDALRIIDMAGSENTMNGMFPTLNDKIWQLYYEFIEVRGTPFFEAFYHTDTVIEGYFQISQPLNKHRERIINLLKKDTRLHLPITRSGATIKDILDAESPIKLLPTDIVLHIRLGDYREANLVIDPAPQLAILRSCSGRLIIVCQTPKTDAERNYLRLFEEFHPIIQHGTELEDFATLRAANRILVSNSTFSWFAAWLGAATERWIPVPTFNDLGAIDPTDHMYTAAKGYSIQDLDIPIEPFLPVTGEYLQSLCDYTVLDQKKKLEFHHWIDAVAPRQLFIEDAWTVTDAKSLFVYPEPGLLEAALAHPWRDLKLIIISNGDNQPRYDVLLPFLEANPTVRAWVQNNTILHPQIRSIPIAEQNRIWRGGSPTFEPTVTICRNAAREYGIVYPWCSETHPIRAVWSKEAKGLRTCRPDMEMFCARIPKEDYLEALEAAHAVVCPPGNGFDTHRHWESLYKGAWAIVKDNAHTACLLTEYPSLPLIPIPGPSALENLEIPEPPSPFHPMLLRPFWKTLFESYVG